MRTAALAVWLSLFATAPTQAEFSNDWEAFAAETRAACDAFEASLSANDVAAPVLEATGDGFAWPRGTPGRPHLCLFYAYDVGADGKPVNVRLLYRGPENAHFRFVRAGMLAVKDRRYIPVQDSFASGVIRIDVISEPGWRYRYWIEELRG